jgi:DNA transformation protein
MSEFTDYLHEVFELADPITIKRMFDGHTVYHQGLPVGIVYDETLFLKADAQTRQYFRVSIRCFSTDDAGEDLHGLETLNLPQFTYRKKDKTIGLPYFQAPDFIFEDRQEAAIWLKRAYEASLRNRPKNSRKPN